MDPWFIVYEFPEKSRLIKTAREINNYKTEWVIEKIKNKALEFELTKGRKPIIACFELAFKPDIDDLRESPALFVVKSLIRQDFEVLTVEPHIKNDIKLERTSMNEALEKMDLGFKLVNHTVFSNMPNNIFNFVR